MSIRKHLPPRSKDAYTSLQVKMETSVVEEVRAFMKLDGILWNDLLTACFKKYLEESRVVHGTTPKDESESNSKVGSTVVCILVLLSLAEGSMIQAVWDIGEYLV